MQKILKKVVLSTCLLLVTCTLPVPNFGTTTIAANSIIKMTKTSYQATANVILRSGSGEQFKPLGTIPKGTILTSTLKNGKWLKVSFSFKVNGKPMSKTGWASSSYLKEYVQYAKTPTKFYFSKGAITLYFSPDTKREAYKIGEINGFSSNEKVINSQGQTWYRISFNGKSLFVKSGDVYERFIETFVSTLYQINVDTYIYEAFGSSHKKLMSIPKGTVLIISNNIGDWYNVSFNGISGYISTYDVSKVSEDKTPETKFITAVELQIRQLPYETASPISSVPKGKVILATHKLSNGWYKVNFNGTIGYVPDSAVKQVATDEPLSSRDNYQFIDLRTQSSVSAKEINDYISAYLIRNPDKSSVLVDKGQVFIDIGKKYGLNALYLAAHAIHESQFGTSNLALGKNNLFGFGAFDNSPFISALRFNSVDLCIDYIARELKATYLNPSYIKRYRGAYLGFSTVDTTETRIDALSEGMNFFYASDPKWGLKIAQHMEKILPYSKSDYSVAGVDLSIPARSVPDGSDIFPNQINAVAATNLVLHSTKGIRDAIKLLPKDSSFLLLEKTNDYWIKVMVNNTVYWTDSIQFYQYSKYFKVLNLGRVTDFPNFRTEPSTASKDTIIKKLTLNDYVSLLLNDDDSVVMDPTRMWYKIQLDDGTQGWVYSAYIERELE